MPTPIRKKNADGSDKSDVWWLRKKVPQRYRALVGRGEIWRSLETTDRKAAGILCVKLSAQFDRDWEHRFQAAKAAGRAISLSAPRLSITELSGLQRLAHEQTRDAGAEKPPEAIRAAFAAGARTEEEDLQEREYDEADMDDFLAGNGYELNEADRALPAAVPRSPAGGPPGRLPHRAEPGLLSVHEAGEVRTEPCKEARFPRDLRILLRKGRY
jgi:hypothetical protein